MPHPGETRQKILQLSQLNLQSTFAAAGALRKDIENQLRSIEYLAREQILQVTALRRRKLIVKNHRGHLLILTRILDQLCLAATDVIRSRRFRQLLRDRINDFGASRTRQFAQVFESILQVPFRDALLFQANQERALLCSFRTRFNHPFARTPENLRRSESIRSNIPASL